MLPPWALTISRAIARPSPVPPTLRSVQRLWTNLSNTASSWSSRMPSAVMTFIATAATRPPGHPACRRSPPSFRVPGEFQRVRQQVAQHVPHLVCIERQRVRHQPAGSRADLPLVGQRLVLVQNGKNDAFGSFDDIVDLLSGLGLRQVEQIVYRAEQRPPRLNAVEVLSEPSLAVLRRFTPNSESLRSRASACAIRATC